MAQISITDETNDILAQTDAIPEEMAAIGDYFAQLDDQVLAQLTTSLYSNAV